MVSGFKNVKWLISVAVCIAVGACSGTPLSDRPNWQEEKITDIKSVAGRWEGLTWMEPKVVREHDWAKVTIKKDGTFKFSAIRTIGAWTGEGVLHLEDGKLVSPRSDQEGTITMTLFKGDGKRMLRVDATNKKGRIQRAELNPSQKKDQP